MRTGTRAGAAGIVLTIGLAGVPGSVAAAGPDRPTLELRVITYASLDPADIDLARQTVTALLATGGLLVVWRECSGDSCAVPANGRPFLLVRLLPIAKRSDPAASGEVVRESVTNAPSVLVYLTRIADVTRSIRQSSQARFHPELSTLAAGHVVGLTIAHEVGHSVGLGHTPSGPMRAQAGPEDFIALRRSMLRFPPIVLDRLQGVTTGPLIAGRRRF
jgi:hypothetical protein